MRRYPEIHEIYDYEIYDLRLASDTGNLQSSGAATMRLIIQRALQRARFLSLAAIALLTGLNVPQGTCSSKGQSATNTLPTLEQVLASPKDLWGEAALRQPGGLRYEFFSGLLPPPRYVNADFKYYPIVLSAPNSQTKARLISNGSAINARGGTRSWNDIGVPVIFRVGPDELRFGEYPHRIDGPHYAQGYLPFVEINYAHGEAVYRQEAFASVDPLLAAHGVVLVRFSLKSGTKGMIAVEVDSKEPLQFEKGTARDEQQRTWLWFDKEWKWTRQRLVASLSSNEVVTLAIATKPVVETVAPASVIKEGYAVQHDQAAELWETLLGRGTRINVPEKIVNDASRALVMGNFSLINGDRIHYSAGNQYDRLYEAEGCDATHALLVWGFSEDARRLIIPLLDFTRKGLEYHQAGHKLQILSHYYWLTRDAEFVRSQSARWKKEIGRIVAGRTNEHGLFPREQYCGDVATPVYSLNSNAKCWRALRDFAAVLNDLGDADEADRLMKVAGDFRTNILRAVEKSERSDVRPPFIPIALLGEEEPYDVITATKIGSYYNLMAPYVLGSRIFGPGSERETWLLQYLQEHGGLCMGLTRSRPNPTFWTGPHSVNPLYGLRRALILLERDEVEPVLVSFYGHLAQGMTRNTFIGGEGCSLTPLDEGGRLFYCPPNSASNGFFLWMLRCLLVQDWDLDDDGVAETLRLSFATPRHWLEDGQTITVNQAPTAFGPVSLRLQSHLGRGEVVADVQTGGKYLPTKTLLRARLPAGWKITSADSGSRSLAVDERGTVNVSELKGSYTVRFKVSKVSSP